VLIQRILEMRGSKAENLVFSTVILKLPLQDKIP